MGGGGGERGRSIAGKKEGLWEQPALTSDTRRRRRERMRLTEKQGQG